MASLNKQYDKLYIFTERNSNSIILTSRFLMKMLVPFEYKSFFPVGSAFSTVGLPLVVFGALANIASVGQKIFYKYVSLMLIKSKLENRTSNMKFI